MAFVVVQHLDPTRKCVLAELLQRCTEMPVSEVTNFTKVQRNHVYVIPPDREMSLQHGTLHLAKTTTPRGMRLPINSFFCSLAEEEAERSVGIVLSGMGTDGTLGLKSIKERGGVVLVQDPNSAKFDGMPRSAVDAGLADIVATAEELPVRLVALLQHTPNLNLVLTDDPDGPHGDLAKIIGLLRRQMGHDFSMYKHNTLYRRIERRMGLHQITNLKNYLQFLSKNPQEVELLFKEMLIGVTSFFRDGEAWDQLRDDVLPALLKARQSGQGLRAWVVGCSTGEEAYSLAIVFKEALERVKHSGDHSLQIFATDLDHDAVSNARQGFFSEAMVAGVSPERLNCFFIEEENGYRVISEIRGMIVFAVQNLVADSPFSNLDILTCRNLLIYFQPELQKKVLPLFHYSLKPGGVLFLGNAESVASFTDLFLSHPGKSRLFWRQDSLKNTFANVFPSSTTSPASYLASPTRIKEKPAANLQTQAEQWLLQHQTPAAVLVNDQGDILFISGRTGRYLEPAAGKANWNILVMAREDLRNRLTSAFEETCRQKETVILRRLKLTESRSKSLVDMRVQYIDEPGALCGMVMIVFTDVPGAAPKRSGADPVSPNDRVRELELEVQRAHAEIRRIREEHQAAQEDLKSTNEEMQSANEELQSLNEELTTSKEELQSVNEELQTVNAELQAKADESSTANNDMKNLLDSTEIATVFLDSSLKVRRFTEQANKVIKLIPGDVGRPITDLATNLIYPDLETDARQVLRTLVPIDKSLVTRDGRSFATRLMPYRTMDNRIDGVVITFTDVSLTRNFEDTARVQAAGTEKGQPK